MKYAIYNIKSLSKSAAINYLILLIADLMRFDKLPCYIAPHNTPFDSPKRDSSIGIPDEIKGVWKREDVNMARYCVNFCVGNDNHCNIFFIARDDYSVKLYEPYGEVLISLDKDVTIDHAAKVIATYLYG